MNTADARASNRQQRQLEAEQDRELMDLAKSGDNQAFRKLVERHQRQAFAVALSWVRNEEDAREIVQEAFLRVHRNLDSYQGTSRFFTWLYRIVTNLAIDLNRRPARRTQELDEELLDRQTESPFMARLDGADPLDLLRRQELAARLQAALDALPPYQRSVIVMREVEGFSYEEMAEAMQVSTGTIMSRLFHARRKLKLALLECYQEHQSDGAAEGVQHEGH